MTMTWLIIIWVAAILGTIAIWKIKKSLCAAIIYGIYALVIAILFSVYTVQILHLL